jgi:septal ring factor EnvC (AmiA/AmiB activator)
VHRRDTGPPGHQLRLHLRLVRPLPPRLLVGAAMTNPAQQDAINKALSQQLKDIVKAMGEIAQQGDDNAKRADALDKEVAALRKEVEALKKKVK